MGCAGRQRPRAHRPTPHTPADRPHTRPSTDPAHARRPTPRTPADRHGPGKARARRQLYGLRKRHHAPALPNTRPSHPPPACPTPAQPPSSLTHHAGAEGLPALAGLGAHGSFVRLQGERQCQPVSTRKAMRRGCRRERQRGPPRPCLACQASGQPGRAAPGSRDRDVAPDALAAPATPHRAPFASPPAPA